MFSTLNDIWVEIFGQKNGKRSAKGSLLGPQTIIFETTLCPIMLLPLPWLNELYFGVTESSFVLV